MFWRVISVAIFTLYWHKWIKILWFKKKTNSKRSLLLPKFIQWWGELIFWQIEIFLFLTFFDKKNTLFCCSCRVFVLGILLKLNFSIRAKKLFGIVLGTAKVETFGWFRVKRYPFASLQRAKVCRGALSVWLSVRGSSRLVTQPAAASLHFRARGAHISIHFTAANV